MLIFLKNYITVYCFIAYEVNALFESHNDSVSMKVLVSFTSKEIETQ